jgi:ADP-ribose pyrophosphatase
MNEDNRWFRVMREDNWFWVAQNVTPDGPDVGAAVLPVTTEGVILQRHRRRAQGGALTYEIPRGLRDPGETLDQCALRELHEETGLLVASDKLHALGHLRPDTGLLASRVAIFWADVGDAQPTAGDGEALGNFPLSRGDLMQWLADHRIEDGFTLTAILRLMIARPDWLRL